MLKTHAAHALILASASAALAQSWQAFPSLPTNGAAREWGAAVLMSNGGIVLVGGTPWVGTASDGAVHEIGPNATAWTSLPALDGPKISQAAGLDSLGRIIVYGGADPVDGDVFLARPYDRVEGLTGDCAERAEAWPAAYFGTARDSMSRLYALGGNNGRGGASSTHVDRYDASTDTWSVLAPMNAAVRDCAAVADAVGHVLVIGGLNTGGTARTANVARYDIASNAWSDSAIPDLPVATSGLRAVMGSDERIYAIGGVVGPSTGGTTVGTVWVLNREQTAWSAAPGMATPRRHFGVVHDSANNRIIVMGGANDSGGTNLCETLFTPRCPVVTAQPRAALAWAGGGAAVSVGVSGSGPFAFQWRRDGVPLSDGPAAGGSTIAGATEQTLVIANIGDADEATYDVVISNACGEVTSGPAAIDVRPSPTAGSDWVVRAIHPVGYEGASGAHGVSSGWIVGSVTTATALGDGRTMSLEHPIRWDTATLNATDLTPPGSVGGALYSVEGSVMTGWFWHTYSCWGGSQYWTCAWQSASLWNDDGGTLREVHISGAEYDTAYDTDGDRVVGTYVTDGSGGVHYSHAMMWTLAGQPTYLHPANAIDSTASAIDGDYQYGSARFEFPWNPSRAIAWNNSAVSARDITPPSATSGAVSGAADGVAVGSVIINGVSHAGMWLAGGEGFADLHPGGSDPSMLAAADQGVQVGYGLGGAALWLGTASSCVSMTSVVPSGYVGPSFNDVEVLGDGTIVIVGSATNSATNRREAMVWRTVPSCVGDYNRDGGVDGDDVIAFFADWDNGNPVADITGDGGVDGDDVIGFFARWDAGC